MRCRIEGSCCERGEATALAGERETIGSCRSELLSSRLIICRLSGDCTSAPSWDASGSSGWELDWVLIMSFLSMEMCSTPSWMESTRVAV